MAPDSNHTQQRRKNLGRLLRPRHIAFIGGAQAADAINACRRAGYEGTIWTVNPRREAIGGIPCVPAITDLPEPPDASLLALSPARSIIAVGELAAVGAGGAVVMAAGFAEQGGEGIALQNELVTAANKGNLALLGPNCMGMLNQFEGAVVWGSENHIERVTGKGAAFISQSGALLFGISNVEQVFPMGYAISTGNQAVIESADCIHAVLDDPRINAIGLYIEGVQDGNALADACQRALNVGVPLVVLKGGDSVEGQSVAISHTGALVVDRDIWDAFANRYGLIEVSSPKAMVETLKLLTIGGLPAGNRLSIVSFSGGLNGIAASRAPAVGLTLPQPTLDNAAKLRARMPETVPIANPLDLNIPWISKTGLSMQDGQAVAEGIVELADGSADMVAFFADVPRPDKNNLDTDWLPSVEGMGYVRETLGIPTVVCGIMPEGLDIGLRRRLQAMGVAPLLGFGHGIEALSVAAKLAAVHAEKKGQPAPQPLLNSAGIAEEKSLMLNEAASKAMLRPYGLVMPASETVNRHSATEAAARLGYPVALKVLSTTIAHKAKAGGVRLGLDSAESVQQAIAEITAAIESAENGHPVEQFLIERMIEQPVAEYIIGIKRHRSMGLALMIGRGGTSVESLRHYTTLLLPLLESEADAALAGFGMVPGSLGFDALKEALRAVARFSAENDQTLLTLDVNPVIITANGDAIAADALIVTTHQPQP